MKKLYIPIWKQAPFIRLVIPFIMGIIVQSYTSFTSIYLITIGCCLFISLLAFQNLPAAIKFKIQPFQGFIITMTLFTLGMVVLYNKEISHRVDWIGHKYHPEDVIIGYIAEPPLAKNKSFKVLLEFDKIIHNDNTSGVMGKMFLYLNKDTLSSSLRYGDRLIFKKPISRIKNAGNPGEFDYAGYCLRKGISHTAFLKSNEWIRTGTARVSSIQAFLYRVRAQIIAHLQRHIKKDDQLYLAEALLIGYTDDLDHDLIKAYSNTGVVHIIAISGMHLGLIYIMLLQVFQRIPFLRRSQLLKTIFLLSGIWLFALLTGGCPSILRSAVMFTCIIIGVPFAKRPVIHNSLALSACILLCYNPYYLWDVGFQLSYLSLYGIVIYQKYLKGLFNFRRKVFEQLWEPCALSIAAQLLTFPVCLYYFHQFPVYFLITNLIAVPLSTLILFVEILLVTIGWLSFAGYYIGKITWFLILVMNKIILFFDHLPYNLVDQINISLAGTIMLYIIVFSVSYYLIYRYKRSLWLALLATMSYSLLALHTNWQSRHQKKIIVYNIPKSQAIDLIDGNSYAYIGDSSAITESMQQFDLKPCRLKFHAFKTFVPYHHGHSYLFYNKVIVVFDSTTKISAGEGKINADLIIMSGNTPYSILSVLEIFTCRNFVFDGSNKMWKIRQWQRECEELNLLNHSVSEKGAYVMDL